MSALITLFKLLPEVLALIKAIEKAIKVAESERKIRDDLNAIRKAFDDKDSKALDHIFNPVTVLK